MTWNRYQLPNGDWDVAKCLPTVRFECPHCGHPMISFSARTSRVVCMLTCMLHPAQTPCRGNGASRLIGSGDRMNPIAGEEHFFYTLWAPAPVVINS